MAAVELLVSGLLPVAGVLAAASRLRVRHRPAQAQRLIVNGLSLFAITAAAALVVPELVAQDPPAAFVLCLTPQVLHLLWALRGRATPPAALPSGARRMSPMSLAGIAIPPSRPAPLAEPAFAPAGWSDLPARHWRGELPLPTSLLLIGGPCGLVLAAALEMAFAELMPDGGETGGAFFALLAVWATVLAALTWLLVGIWRAAERTLDRRARLGRPAGRVWLAQAIVVLAVVFVAMEWATHDVRTIAPGLRPVPESQGDVPPYAMRLMRDGTEMEIAGGFQLGLSSDFARFVSQAPQLRVVHLTSGGGKLWEGRRLADMIRARGLVTYVSRGCYSACTIAFAAGRERWLREGAVLGYHAPSAEGVTDEQLSVAAEGLRRTYIAARIEPAFAARAVATPHDEIWTPNVAELRRANVITDITDGRDFAPPGRARDFKAFGWRDGTTTATRP